MSVRNQPEGAQAVTPNLLLHVVAAIIVKNNRVFIARRAKHKASAGVWEFPGGKLRRNELPQDALKREIYEELGVEIFPIRRFNRSVTAINDVQIDLDVFLCDLVSPNIVNSTDHDELEWVRISELSDYVFCGPDMPSVKQLIENGLGDE